jgi:Oxidoreductase molybdopterin binding domain
MFRGLLLCAMLLPIATPLYAACPGGPSKKFDVEGQVTNVATFDLDALKKNFSPAQANITYFAAGSVVSNSYTGALLWDVLNNAPVGGIVTNPNIKNDILSMVVIVEGTDCYTAVFGAGEIDPFFGGSQVIIAYASNGQPLGTDGVAQIVVPGDKAGGRFVSNIAKIEVKAASDQ